MFQLQGDIIRPLIQEQFLNWFLVYDWDPENATKGAART